MEETSIVFPDGYIPKDKRKKILLLADDLRFSSGVGTMSREIIVGTAHKFSWVNLGAGVNHPNHGSVIDCSESLSNDLNIPDASLKIYPYNGYGDIMIIRQLIKLEQPDMIMHFTDPRYWVWLYQMEHEVRDKIPLIYYHVWDNLPAPVYNKSFYRSCDAIFSISKQTHNIVKQVLGEEQCEVINNKLI